MAPEDRSPLLEPPPPQTVLERIESWIHQAWESRLTSRIQCLELSQQALNLAQTEGYLHGQGYALRNLGFCAYQAANFEEALGQLSQSLRIAGELHDATLERDSLNYIGAIYAGLGELESALEYVERTYHLNQALGDESGIAASLNNIGIVYTQMGREEDSVRVKLEGVELARKLGDSTREAFTLCNLVSSYVALERLEEAVQTSYRALELCQEQKLDDLEIKVRVNLAEALGLQGRYDEALSLLQWVLEQTHNSGIKEPLIHCWLNMARVYLGQNNHSQALEKLEQALSQSQALGAKDLESQVHQRLADIHKEMGSFALALEHYEAYHRLEQGIRAESAERRLRVLSISRDLEKTKAEAEIQRLRNVELARALEALEQANREKSALVQALELQVIQDPLTKLYNRRHLEDTLAEEFAQAQKTYRPLAVAIIDVDNFKHINDQFSHQIGDNVLQTIAEVMSRSARLTDIVARYGGEEFVLVLPRTTLEAAIRVCERLRTAVEGHDWSSIHPDLRVSISLGLAADIHLSNHEKLLGAADAKLYEAKHAGKNCLKY